MFQYHTLADLSRKLAEIEAADRYAVQRADRAEAERQHKLATEYERRAYWWDVLQRVNRGESLDEARKAEADARPGSQWPTSTASR